MGIPRYGDFLKKRNYSRGHGSLINRYVFVYPTGVVTGIGIFSHHTAAPGTSCLCSSVQVTRTLEHKP